MGAPSIRAIKSKKASASFFCVTCSTTTSACVFCANDTAYLSPSAESSEKSMGTRIFRTVFIKIVSLKKNSATRLQLMFFIAGVKRFGGERGKSDIENRFENVARNFGS